MKREIEAVWEIEHDDAMQVKALWWASTPAHLGTALLKNMKTAIRDELFPWYSTFPHSSPIISSFAHVYLRHYKDNFSLSI